MIFSTVFFRLLMLSFSFIGYLIPHLFFFSLNMLLFCFIKRAFILIFLALKQVTRGFDCKSRCSSRTYEYLLPTFAFSPTFAVSYVHTSIRGQCRYADNNIRREQRFYSLPKRYKQIRRFEQRPFVTLIPDEWPLLETSNLFLSLR